MADKSGRLLVGLDWATEVHEVCVLDDEGNKLAERRVEHSAAELASLCQWLSTGFGDRRPDDVHVAIEMPRGVVVDTLLERGFAVYAINPKQVDRFRDRFSMSGAKDDRRDALVLADSLRTDAHCFRVLEVDDPLIVELREWSRMSDDLQQERVKLTNRVREQLRRYFPQFLRIAPDVGAGWFLELWEQAPTPAAARRTRQSTIARILKSHRIRRITAEEVQLILREPALAVAPGVIEAASAHLRLLRERLAVLNHQIKECKKKLRELIARIADAAPGNPGPCSGQRDVEIILSLPGVGTSVSATLLAEASRALQARDYHALRALSGIAPVTKRSGKRKPTILMRQSCNQRLRNAMYHMARVASQRDPACRQRYAALRAKGHGHGRALRSIADRLLGILLAMLRTQTPYRCTRESAA